MKITNAAYLPLLFNESSQVNSLRWQALYKNPDGSFEDQTGVFKCKDYFNDIVAKYQGFDTCAYGFNTLKMKYNEEGVYVLCSRLTHVECFLDNVKTISVQGQQQGFPALSAEAVDKSSCLLFFPREYFRSSYITSLLTYLVRLAHCNMTFPTFKEFIEDNPTRTVDRPFRDKYAKITEAAFKEPVDKCWGYYGKTKRNLITKENSPAHSSIIHNAGCYNWHYMLDLDI